MAYNTFEKWLFEADGDPPDIDGGASDNQNTDTSSNDISEDAPPDIGSFDDSGGDSGGDESFDTSGLEDIEDDPQAHEMDGGVQNMQLSEKISAILNNILYQRFLSMLNTVGGQLTSIKNNNDVMISLIKDDYDEFISKLKKLEENIRLYLKNNFIHNDYSKNLLFFNMCLNLQKLLNDQLDEKVHKAIKAAQ